jgi:hypothetical protein
VLRDLQEFPEERSALRTQLMRDQTFHEPLHVHTACRRMGDWMGDWMNRWIEENTHAIKTNA